MKNRLSIFVVLLIAILTANLGSFQTSVQAQTLTVSQQEGCGSSQEFGRSWEQSYEPQRGVRILKTYSIKPGWSKGEVQAEIAMAQKKFEKTLKAKGAAVKLLDNSTPRILSLVEERYDDLTCTIQYQVNGLSLDAVTSLMMQPDIQVFNVPVDVNADTPSYKVYNPVTDDKIEEDVSSFFDNLQVVANSQSGKEVIVFVFDLGFDTDNQRLRGYFKSNFKEIPNNGIDDDDNGVVDDTIYMYNAVPADGHPLNLMVNGTHGTYVLGKLVLSIIEAEKIAQTTANVKIVPIKVVGLNDKTGNNDQLLAGMIYAKKIQVDNPGAKFVYNFSLGYYPYSSSVDLLLAEAFKLDTFIATAAGNRFGAGAQGLDLATDKSFPANYGETVPLVVVGASDSNDAKAIFSNFGRLVRFFAPAVNVDCIFGVGSGTSFAVPQASGLAAVLMGLNDITAWQCIQKMTLSSIKGQILNNEVYPGGGILSPAQAITQNHQLSAPVFIEPLKVNDKKVVVRSNGQVLKVVGMPDTQPKISSGKLTFKLPLGNPITKSKIIISCPEGGNLIELFR